MMRQFINIVENAQTPASLFVSEIGHGDEFVYLNFTVDGISTVTIEQLWSEQERGAGHGSRWMKKVVETADKLGITLKLIASPLHYDLTHDGYDDDPRGYDHLADLNTKALDAERLKKWYEGFGFVFDAVHDSDGVRFPR